jgi:hypothetical protein
MIMTLSMPQNAILRSSNKIILSRTDTVQLWVVMMVERFVKS